MRTTDTPGNDDMAERTHRGLGRRTAAGASGIFVGTLSALAWMAAIASANLLVARFLAFSSTSIPWMAATLATMGVAWRLGRTSRSLRTRSGGADTALEEGLGILADFSDERVGVVWSGNEEVIRRVMLTILALIASGAAIVPSLLFLPEAWARFAVIFVGLSCGEWLLYYWLPPVKRRAEQLAGWSSA